jgi:hypothetical protein
LCDLVHRGDSAIDLIDPGRLFSRCGSDLGDDVANLPDPIDDLVECSTGTLDQFGTGVTVALTQ